MIVLHHLNNSRSQRILWLLEELDVHYRMVRYERDPKTQAAPPELAKIHPLGKAPVVEDNGQVLAESAIIIQYLAEHHNPKLLPPAGSPQRLQCDYWLHYAEGSLMPLLLIKLIFSEVESAPMPFFAKPVARKISSQVHAEFIDPRLRQHVDFLEKHLKEHRWFLGDFLTAADFQMSFPLDALVSRGGNSVGPAIRNYVKRIHALPSYRRALEKGGDYAYA